MIAIVSITTTTIPTDPIGGAPGRRKQGGKLSRTPPGLASCARVTTKWPSNGNSSFMRSGTITVSRPLASLHFVFPFCQNQQFATHTSPILHVLPAADLQAASVRNYPAGAGSAAIFRSMSPNICRVR
jgi:hypothetical protein